MNSWAQGATSQRSIPPATALLLRCGSIENSRLRTEDIRSAAGAVKDWHRFFELASRHAVVPLADQALTLAGAGIVPEGIADQLRSASLRGAMSALQLSADLVFAMRALAAAGVDAMPFKGPTLAALVYGNLSLRQYQDLDILVHRADVERTRTVLLSLGYLPAIAYDDDQRATLQLSGHHEQLVRDGVTVELHWSLNNWALTHDTFERCWWEDRQPVTIGGVAMRTLGPERLLLYLCMHGGKHSWARLGWLFDLEFALRAYPAADWNAIWRLARENGAARMVGIGLALVRELLDEHELVSCALKSQREDPRAAEVVRLICDRIRGDEVFEPYLDYRVQMRSRERVRDRLRYTWHIVAAPHPADVTRIGLPRALHRMYYVLRPLRLVWKRIVRRVHAGRAT